MRTAGRGEAAVQPRGRQIERCLRTEVGHAIPLDGRHRKEGSDDLLGGRRVEPPGISRLLARRLGAARRRGAPSLAPGGDDAGPVGAPLVDPRRVADQLDNLARGQPATALFRLDEGDDRLLEQDRREELAHACAAVKVALRAEHKDLVALLDVVGAVAGDQIVHIQEDLDRLQQPLHPLLDNPHLCSGPRGCVSARESQCVRHAARTSSWPCFHVWLKNRWYSSFLLSWATRAGEPSGWRRRSRPAVSLSAA